MQLTITKVEPYKTSTGKDFVKLSFESEKVVVFSSDGYPNVQQLKAEKSWPADAVAVLLPEAKAGDTTSAFGIRTKQTFLPSRSLAQDAAAGRQKVQPFSGSKKTKKIYLSNGMPFFSTIIVERAQDADGKDEILPNITSISVEGTALAKMLDGQRPTMEDFADAGIALNPVTVAKLVEPLVATPSAPAPTERAEEANEIGQTAQQPA